MTSQSPSPTSKADHPHRRIITIPNLLTAFRIVAMPFIVYFLRHSTPPSDSHLVIGAAVFGLVFLTDQLDGIIARRTNQVTQLGKIMDPLADKIIVVTALMLLIHMHMLPVWIAVVIASRELVVNALRALAQSEGVSLPPNWIGKSKAYFEGFGIAFVLLGKNQHFANIPWWQIGMVLMYLAVITATISAVQYFLKYYDQRKIMEKNV